MTIFVSLSNLKRCTSRILTRYWVFQPSASPCEVVPLFRNGVSRILYEQSSLLLLLPSERRREREDLEQDSVT